MRVRKAKEATSETLEELQGADESYWIVFPVKFTEQFSANRSVVFKSLYVIVFEDHMFQSNQLGSCVHIWTLERLEQWCGDRRDFLAILPSHTTCAAHSPHTPLSFTSVSLKYANYACSAGYCQFLFHAILSATTQAQAKRWHDRGWQE